MNQKVQVLRFAAIAAVVMIHTYIQDLSGVLIRPFLNYAVGLFLFLSGYLTGEQKISRSTISRRIRKVLIPYLLWSCVYAAAYGRLGSLPKNLLTFSANGTFYYIFVYIQMTLVTPLCFRLLRSKYSPAGFLITPVSLLLLRYLPAFLGWNPPFPLNSCFGGLWLSFYYLGLGLGNGYFPRIPSRKKTVALYAAALLAAAAEGLAWYFAGSYDLATTQLKLTTVTASLCVCLLAFHYLRSGKPEATWERCAARVGNSSFGIYLSHMLILSVLGKIPGYSRIPFPISSVLVLAASWICVVTGRKVLGSRFAGYLGLYS